MSLIIKVALYEVEEEVFVATYVRKDFSPLDVIGRRTQDMIVNWAKKEVNLSNPNVSYLGDADYENFVKNDRTNRATVPAAVGRVFVVSRNEMEKLKIDRR